MKRGLSTLLLVGLLLIGMDAQIQAATLSGPGSAKASKVELFTTSWCPYCRKAEAFLQANGIPFVSYDIEKDSQAAARKRQLDRRKGVPLALINGQVLYGFSERLYRTALELDEPR